MDGDDDLTPIPFSQLPLKERVAKSQSWDKPNRQACNFIIMGIIFPIIGAVFVVAGFGAPGHDYPLTALQTYPLLDPLPLQGIGFIMIIGGLVICAVSIYFRRYRNFVLYLVENPHYYSEHPSEIAPPLYITCRNVGGLSSSKGFLGRDLSSLHRTPAPSNYARSDNGAMEEIDLGDDAATIGRQI